MWTIFKVFIEFITILLLFYVFFFWSQGTWDLSSPTKDWTCTPCIGKWSLNHWTTREVPKIWFFIHPPTHPTVSGMIGSVLCMQWIWASLCCQVAYRILHQISRSVVSDSLRPHESQHTGVQTLWKTTVNAATWVRISVTRDTWEGHVTSTSRGRWVSGKAFQDMWHRSSLMGCWGRGTTLRKGGPKR